MSKFRSFPSYNKVNRKQIKQLFKNYDPTYVPAVRQLKQLEAKYGPINLDELKVEEDLPIEQQVIPDIPLAPVGVIPDIPIIEHIPLAPVGVITPEDFKEARKTFSTMKTKWFIDPLRRYIARKKIKHLSDLPEELINKVTQLDDEEISVILKQKKLSKILI